MRYLKVVIIVMMFRHLILFFTFILVIHITVIILLRTPYRYQNAFFFISWLIIIIFFIFRWGFFLITISWSSSFFTCHFLLLLSKLHWSLRIKIDTIPKCGSLWAVLMSSLVISYKHPLRFVIFPCTRRFSEAPIRIDV